MLSNCHPAKPEESLGHHPYMVAQARQESSRIRIPEENLSFIPRKRSRERPQDRGFPRAVRADQGYSLSRRKPNAEGLKLEQRILDRKRAQLDVVISYRNWCPLGSIRLIEGVSHGISVRSVCGLGCEQNGPEDCISHTERPENQCGHKRTGTGHICHSLEQPGDERHPQNMKHAGMLHDSQSDRAGS